MKALFDKLVHLGIRDSQFEDTKERIRFLNGISLLGVPFCTVYAIIFFATGFPVAGCLSSIGVLVFFLPHILITIIGFDVTRIIVALVVPAYFCLLSILCGAETGYYLGFLVISFPPLLFFGRQKTALIFVGWSATCLALSIVGMATFEPTVEVPFTMGIFLSNIIVVYCSQVITILFFKRELTGSRTIIRIKNKEVVDSIVYARRIQEAILPSETLIKQHLPDSFILYKPKDIVAGDFYWLEKLGDDLIFAAADCTGHGVPGAMVSVVCNNALNRAVREFNLREPGEILDVTRNLVIEQFAKSNEDVKDGMDIALCTLNGNTLKFAGANNPLWILRKGESDVEVLRANKEPIGKVENLTPFITHTTTVKPGDTLYLFSDGFADQFGGDKGKKLKTKPFKHLLASLQQQTMQEQCEAIDQFFETWRGDLEQLDDVCVVGVRV